MKITDVTIGQSYAYDSYPRSQRYGNNEISFPKFTVTDIRVEKVKNVSTYGYRQTRMVIGYFGDSSISQERRIKAEHLVRTWEAQVALVKRYAEAKQSSDERTAAVNAERDPKIAQAEAALLALGVAPKVSSHLAYGLHEDGSTQPDVRQDDGYWYESLVIKSVLDREKLIKGGKVEISLDDLLTILAASGR